MMAFSLAGITVDFRALTLSLEHGPVSEDLLALRCSLCRRLTLGCRKHWFCGVCRGCQADAERGA